MTRPSHTELYKMRYNPFLAHFSKRRNRQNDSNSKCLGKLVLHNDWSVVRFAGFFFPAERGYSKLYNLWKVNESLSYQGLLFGHVLMASAYRMR